MRCRVELIVGPACQNVADIYDKRAGQICGRYPAAVNPSHFQAADIVLGEDGEEAIVGVWMDAIEILWAINRRGRIVNQSRRRARRIKKPAEELRRLTHRNGKYRQELKAELTNGRVVALYRRDEMRIVGP